MISGVVNADLEAIVQLTVRGPSGRVRRILAVIDTGYSGSLTLPPAIIADLRLVWLDSGNAFLADGSEVFFDVFDGAIVWDRRNVAIQVDEADTTPLVGTELLAGNELKAEFRPRGKVLIAPIKRRRS